MATRHGWHFLSDYCKYSKGWLKLMVSWMTNMQSKKYPYPFPFLRSPFLGIKVAVKVLSLNRYLAFRFRREGSCQLSHTYYLHVLLIILYQLFDYSGLVTKCPTMISMRSVPAEEKWSAHVTLQRGWDSDRQNDDLSQPVSSTEALADLLAAAAAIISSRSGSPNGFSKEYIHVTVSSPQLPDLTVIDLPGIIRTTTSGQVT